MVKLSNLEISIMYVIWDKGEVTAYEIFKELSKEKEISKYTIRTLLARMVMKNAICVCRKNGNEYIYSALINKDEFLRKENLDFLKWVYNDNIREMMLNYIREGKLMKNDLEIIMEELNKN